MMKVKEFLLGGDALSHSTCIDDVVTGISSIENVKSGTYHRVETKRASRNWYGNVLFRYHCPNKQKI